ncbi:hypothetical protein QBC46DRAFT_424015 [Diplogelasinospora grovesii]|uniref:Uncharacterized protein n=1 Tax=Diplogelasinospora grovesii TaxID=303347 RepID=A0AAN6NCY2_9PEZI|nr:hypothetical protein QBC46DRAFT_424015 [Diplogelasinospora grovesii]
METPARVGARLLNEIEEASLEEILTALRTTTTSTNANDNSTENAPAQGPPTGTRPRAFPFAPLDDLVTRHFRATGSAPLAATGDEYHELLYVLIATLIAPPYEKVVTVLDFEGHFDAQRLLICTPFTEPTSNSTTSDVDKPPRPEETESSPPAAVRESDLEHVRIMRARRCPPAQVEEILAGIEKYMLYGPHSSRGREWWGTIVIEGGLLSDAARAAATSSPQVAVIAGYSGGWLRVSRPVGSIFETARTIEEAFRDREKHRAAVDAAGWVATSVWGGFRFGQRALEQ